MPDSKLIFGVFIAVFVDISVVALSASFSATEIISYRLEDQVCDFFSIAILYFMSYIGSADLNTPFTRITTNSTEQGTF